MMWPMLLLLAQAAPNSTQDAGLVAQGAKIFAEQCSVAYCHGAGGAAGRAPALARRNFERSSLRNTIASGRPPLGMPSFEAKLGPDLDAVVAYVLSLSPAQGAAAAPTEGAASDEPKRAKPTGDALAGRDLFFDSSRLPSCAACHSVKDSGGSIASSLLSAPASPDALRNVTAANLITVGPAGEAAFPGIPQSASKGSVRAADVSSPLPVIRTFRADAVQLTPGASWNHRSAVDRYSENELRLILTWLKWEFGG